MDFRPITLECRSEIFPILYRSEKPICDLAFANLFGWGFLYETCWAIGGTQTLVIRFRSPKHDHPVFLLPYCRSETSWQLAIEQLAMLSHEAGHPLVFMGVTPYCRQRVEEAFPGIFSFHWDDAAVDYIYPREQLVSLTGKKLQPKRNHINRFKREYPDWHFTPLSPSLLPLCTQFADEWLAAQSDTVQGLCDENQMIHRVLGAYTALELQGGALFVKDQMVAFTLGSPINSNTFDIQVEKANDAYQGAYAMINQCFAATIPAQYGQINREEDLGIEGLRQAKRSYQPSLELEKGIAIWQPPTL